MNKILDSFSTRETALIIWIFIIIALVLFGEKQRKSFFIFIKALFVKDLIIVFLLFFIHTFIYVFIINEIGYWDKSLLKDTVFWSIGFGIVTIFKVNEINSNSDFKKLVIESISWTIIIEYLINFYTFSLLTELIMLPSLTFLIMVQTYASYGDKNKEADLFFKIIIVVASTWIFIYSFYKTITSNTDFFTIANLKIFLFPLILSITFLPFLYIFNLIVKYDSLFSTLKYKIQDNRAGISLKRKIIIVANMNIDKVESISRNISSPIKEYNDFSYDMVKKVSRGKYIGLKKKE